MTFVEYIASPPVFVTIGVVFGLAIGSFLNVVIHRLPKMMERDWQAQCAELRGETPPAQPRYNLVMPRSRCPSCGHPITALENIPIASYLWLRGKCCRVPRADQRPLPAGRGVDRDRHRVLRLALRVRLRGLRGDALHVVHDRARVHRHRHPAPARLDHAAAALGRAALQPARDLRRPPVGGDRRGRRLSRAVDRLLGVQVRDRQGGHGLRRLQAARRDRRVARLEDAAARDPRLLVRRRGRRASG